MTSFPTCLRKKKHYTSHWILACPFASQIFLGICQVKAHLLFEVVTPQQHGNNVGRLISSNLHEFFLRLTEEKKKASLSYDVFSVDKNERWDSAAHLLNIHTDS